MSPSVAQPRFLHAPLGWDKGLALILCPGAAAERPTLVALEVKGTRERFLP